MISPEANLDERALALHLAVERSSSVGNPHNHLYERAYTRAVALALIRRAFHLSSASPDHHNPHPAPLAHLHFRPPTRTPTTIQANFADR
jgi:hypothetical protein